MAEMIDGRQKIEFVREELTSAEAIASLLRASPDLRLAVFGGCETAQSSDASAASTAPKTTSRSTVFSREIASTNINISRLMPSHS